MIYQPRNKSHHVVADQHHKPITLPDPPRELAIPPAATDETAPRSLPVRGVIDWRKDPVLRRAGRLG